MKMLISAIAVGVAIAATAMPVLAEELPSDDIFIPTPIPSSTPEFDWNDGLPDDSVLPLESPDIGSESDSIGEFGEDDTYINDIYNQLLEKLQGVDFDLTEDAPADAESSPTPDMDFSFDDSVSDSELIEPYANYDTYYGSIGSTYLEYMRGYLPKLGFREHYVAARTSQYQYIFAYGEDLSFNGNLFTGHDINVVTWLTNNNGSFSHNVESSFNLSANNYLVYSDLSDIYPTLSDLSGFTLRQILILAVIVALVCTMSSMYQVRKIRKLGMH